MANVFNATTTTGLQLTPDNSGAVQFQTNNGTTALTISTAQQAAFAQSVSATQGLSSASYLSPFASGYRNRIINGSMGIAQRGTSFSSPASGTYTLDRWIAQWGGAALTTVAQVAGPTGYRYALQVTGTAGNTTAPIVQRIESYNCSDLSGQTVTIQANISVSSAQTVLWQLLYPSAQDNWSSATLIASGTWSATTTATVFTATITGLPSGATNGLQLAIAPQNGGAFTSGTITITGVQLELGSVATPFEVRSVGTELALCQRYYEKSYDTGTAPGSATTDGACFFPATVANSFASFPFAVEKRIVPSISVWDTAGNSNCVTTGNGAAAITTGSSQTSPVQYVGTRNVCLRLSNSVSGAITAAYHFVAIAEL